MKKIFCSIIAGLLLTASTCMAQNSFTACAEEAMATHYQLGMPVQNVIVGLQQSCGEELLTELTALEVPDSHMQGAIVGTIAVFVADWGLRQLGEAYTFIEFLQNTEAVCDEDDSL